MDTALSNEDGNIFGNIFVNGNIWKITNTMMMYYDHISSMLHELILFGIAYVDEK